MSIAGGRKKGIKYFMFIVLLLSAAFTFWMIINEGDRSGPTLVRVESQIKILDDFEKHGIWKVDRQNHRCLIDLGIWARMPFEKKEQCLQAIYIEEKTWWEIYDCMSGKLLGKVSSWGVKVYP